MNKYQLARLSPEQFLATYWQKKPCVIRQAFTDFVDPIDEHDLAGLASEEDIDSRIISQSVAGWNITHGPFSEFDSVCVDKWSLLVQGVDRHIPDIQPLMNAFNFLPYWRTDDLMVSFSAKGAGVGPHLDQYDVFIVQGKGSRRWQVGLPGKHQSIYPHPQLRQIEMFDPIIDEILYPGDLIYIPPGFPHNGVAMEECLNYSIGFRAPSQQDLLSSLADYALQTNRFNQRYSDPAITSRPSAALIQHQEIHAFKTLMIESINSPDFDDFLLSHLSRSDNIDEQDEIATPYHQQHIFELLQDGHAFFPIGGLKPVYQATQTTEFRFYLDGQGFTAPYHCQPLFIQLFEQTPFKAKNITESAQWLDFVQLLTILINAGYWFPE